MFFFWSLSIIGVLDFSGFGRLRSDVSGFMAQGGPRGGRFWARGGSTSRGSRGRDSGAGWSFRVLWDALHLW